MWSIVLYAGLTFALGTVAGFQIMYARYPREYQLALGTAPCLLYLCIRGALPAALYVALHKSVLTAPNVPPALQAVALGLGSEAFLRSRILFAIRNVGPEKLPAEESKGPADIISWFQGFFLTQIGKTLVSRRMSKVNFFFAKSTLTFEDICHGFKIHLAAIEDPGLRTKVQRIAEKTLAEFVAEQSPVSAEIEKRYRLKLGYALYFALDIEAFRALSKRINPRTH